MTLALRALVPSAVEVDAATADDETDLAGMPAAEREWISGAVPRRQREFAGVRACARRALERLGSPAVALVPRPDRSPVWPDGVVGSLTHCAGLRAAAVARAAHVAAIGIDAEPHAPLPDGVLNLTATPDERDMLAELRSAHPLIAWDRLLFSVKESVFKAWWPLTGAWLGFDDAACTISASGSVSARILIDHPAGADRAPRTFDARWAVTGPIGAGHVLTAVVVPTITPPTPAAPAPSAPPAPRP